MSDFGLFIGWGETKSGKEAAADKVFGEAVGYWNGLKGAGEIESLELVILGAHGGDLGGFALLRGAPEKLAAINMSPEFTRLVMRAGTCLESVGVVQAYVDGGVMNSMSVWRETVADLI